MSVIKTKKISTLLIGHVNKEGNLAGPKVLEHLVDAVFLLEGERDQSLRLLRSIKNRYGTVNEVGMFEMDERGLRELKNPSERIIESRPKNSFGSCLTVTIEGNRPILMEVQALVNTSPFGYPKRAASGFDRNRLELLIAVIEKHTDLSLSDKDVYINITGGLYLKDPAADLAVCMAIASSLKKKVIAENLVIFGEVGLAGEVRKPLQNEARIKSVKKLNFLTFENIRSIREALSSI